MRNPYLVPGPDGKYPKDRVQLVIFFDGHPGDILRTLNGQDFGYDLVCERGAQKSYRYPNPVTVEFAWSADGERTLYEYAKEVVEGVGCWRTVGGDGFPDFQLVGTVCFFGPDSRDDPHFGYHLDEGWYCQHEACGTWIEDQITHWKPLLPPSLGKNTAPQALKVGHREVAGEGTAAERTDPPPSPDALDAMAAEAYNSVRRDGYKDLSAQGMLEWFVYRLGRAGYLSELCKALDSENDDPQAGRRLLATEPKPDRGRTE